MSDILLVEQVSPSAPSANQALIYPKVNKSPHYMADDGVERKILTDGNIIENEIPGGLVNGANDTYTLAHTPVANSTKLFLNGVRMRLTTDYTEVAATIVYAAAAKPQTGDNHVVDYRW